LRWVLAFVRVLPRCAARALTVASRDRPGAGDVTFAPLSRPPLAERRTDRRDMCSAPQLVDTLEMSLAVPEQLAPVETKIRQRRQLLAEEIGRTAESVTFNVSEARSAPASTAPTYSVAPPGWLATPHGLGRPYTSGRCGR
jgi:hypothetical protein